MAIKLYKSQLEPTTVSSNVESKAFVSMEEAASIGKSFKGMVKSGEKLYYKYLDRKTDNEVLEKSKEVMNGNDNFSGLGQIKVEANQMNDPDKALKLYNDNWQTVFDTVNGSLSGKMAQRKFKSWMTKQNITDANSIKAQTTANFISHTRSLNLDKVEVWKKQILYGGKLESDAAANELKYFLESTKAKEIFGNKLDAVIKNTHRDIAFYGYKNARVGDQDAALAAAKKDKRLEIDDVQKLMTYFETSNTSFQFENRASIKTMLEKSKEAIFPTEEEVTQATNIAIQTKDKKSIANLKTIADNISLYSRLNTMDMGEIKAAISAGERIINKGQMTGKGTDNETYTKVTNMKAFLAKLEDGLNKDPISIANERGIISTQSIQFENFLNTGEIEPFLEAIKTRRADARTVSGFYKTKLKFLTTNELDVIQATFENVTNPGQLIALTASLVKGFEEDSDIVFKEISKKNPYLAHLGGLVLTNGADDLGVKLSIKGYLASKNNNLKFNVSETEAGYISILSSFRAAFPNNEQTYNAVIETAKHIYMGQKIQEGKNIDIFDKKLWNESIQMAAGGNTKDGIIDTDYGGIENSYKGKMVHIPSWMPRGKFDDVVEMLKTDVDLLIKATGNTYAMDDKGKVFDIFKNADPYFISAGYGKYIVALGEHPSESFDAEFVMDDNGGLLIIDLHNIKDDIGARLGGVDSSLTAYKEGVVN